MRLHATDTAEQVADDPEVRKAAEALAAALGCESAARGDGVGPGFALVTGSFVDAQVTEATLRAARWLFSRPDAANASLMVSGRERGDRRGLHRYVGAAGSQDNIQAFLTEK